ncbi:MAG: hypothetical protein HQL94_09195 [Magnetococcales bacterium]|nr:hypothetical protein [Magnetococcales bacterium]
MAELPKKIKKPKTQASTDTAFVEPSVEEVELLQEQLIKDEEIILAGRLEELKKIKEIEQLSGKPKKIEKVNIDDLKFTTEERKVGLPDHIKKLPKDHAVRVLYEKGFKVAPKPVKRFRSRRETFAIKEVLIDLVKYFGLTILIFLVLGGGFYGVQQYQDGVADLRLKILNSIKEQKFSPTHPRVAKEFNKLYWSNWQPDLKKLLDYVDGLGVNYEAFDGNPEPGSYVDYIKRHNKPFNKADALEWYAREMRKPTK